MAGAAHLVENGLVVVDRAAGRDLRVRPSVIRNDLSAAIEEGFQVWIHRIHVLAGLQRLVEIGIPVQRFEVPVRIVEHDVLEQVHARSEWLSAGHRRPSDFTARRKSCDEGLLCPAVAHVRINLSCGFNLRRRQAGIGVLCLAQQNLGIELAHARILNDAVFDSVNRIACGDRCGVDGGEFACGIGACATACPTQMV